MTARGDGAKRCQHCERVIELDDGIWVDPEATGDDSVWRETCDANDTFEANHEPTSVYLTWYHDFDTAKGMADAVDPRGVEVEVTSKGVTLTAYDLSGESVIGSVTMTYEAMWQKAAGR